MKRDLNRALSRRDVCRLLDTARAFDLDRGGCYDARGGAVNLWATKEDAPAGWREALGTGDGACDVVGTLWWLFDEEGGMACEGVARLQVEATPYALVKVMSRRRAAEMLAAAMSGGGTGLLAPEQQAACLDWCEAKARELLRLAELAPHVVGVLCPWCSFLLPTGSVFNELLEHIAVAHPAEKVREVVLGTEIILRTDRGDVLPQSVERFEKEGQL